VLLVVRKSPNRLSLVNVLVALLLGTSAPVLLGADNEGPAFQEGQIHDLATGRPVSFEEFAARLAANDVVYLGEEHYNRFHIEAAIKLLEALLDRKQLPVLGLEMFSWDGQAALDRFLADPAVTKDSFLQEAHWKQNWGGAYEEYAPLISFARDHHLPVIALNPPRALVREVAKQGIAQAGTNPDMAKWGMQDERLVEDPDYRGKILQQLRACHGGMPDAAYQRMYEASVFRDEGMAKTISEYLQRLPKGAGPIVSYTGGGHIQYKLPVPNRVQRRQSAPLRQITVYLTGIDPGRTQDIQDLLQSSIADYVWLTPLSTRGPSRRCL
jgi:uncharacterized iron-regulated protein